MISRLNRRNRQDIIFKSSGGMLDDFDNAIKAIYRINDAEYDYMAEKMSDSELDLFSKDEFNYSEKRKILVLLETYMKKYHKL
jgi:hypothetical protein